MISSAFAHRLFKNNKKGRGMFFHGLEIPLCICSIRTVGRWAPKIKYKIVAD